MTIDAEKLEEAAEQAMRRFTYATVANTEYAGGPSPEQLLLLAQAARALAPTLPRYKEVEVVRWGVVDQHGDCFRSEVYESDAREWLKNDRAWQVVRLTGTAKVKVQG